jgi:hypothetical protein
LPRQHFATKINYWLLRASQRNIMLIDPQKFRLTTVYDMKQLWHKNQCRQGFWQIDVITLKINDYVEAD